MIDADPTSAGPRDSNNSNTFPVPDVAPGMALAATTEALSAKIKECEELKTALQQRRSEIGVFQTERDEFRNLYTEECRLHKSNIAQLMREHDRLKAERDELGADLAKACEEIRKYENADVGTPHEIQMAEIRTLADRIAELQAERDQALAEAKEWKERLEFIEEDCAELHSHEDKAIEAQQILLKERNEFKKRIQELEVELADLTGCLKANGDLDLGRLKRIFAHEFKNRNTDPCDNCGLQTRIEELLQKIAKIREQMDCPESIDMGVRIRTLMQCEIDAECARLALDEQYKERDKRNGEIVAAEKRVKELEAQVDMREEMLDRQDDTIADLKTRLAAASIAENEFKGLKTANDELHKRCAELELLNGKMGESLQHYSEERGFLRELLLNLTRGKA